MVVIGSKGEVNGTLRCKLKQSRVSTSSHGQGSTMCYNCMTES